MSAARRPVIGQVLFGADDGDRALVARFAQLFGGPGGGQAAPDDDDPTGFAHEVFLTRPAIGALDRFTAPSTAPTPIIS